MNYFIDIESPTGIKYGDGALTTCTEWESKNVLDGAGSFTFRVPASDPRTDIIQPKRVARCYTRVLDSVVEIGSGIIDKITSEVDSSGNTIKTVEGSDLLRELTYRSVGFLSLSDGAGNGVNNPIAQIMSYAPDGWSVDQSVGTQETETNVYASFSGESILDSLTKVSDNRGEHFRLSQGRKIAWLGKNLTSSGIRAVQDGDPISVETNDSICIVQKLEEQSDTYSVFTRIYPYGSGTGTARLTLASTTRVVPAGFALDKTNNCLINTQAESQYGRIEKYISFKEISPISNSDLDLESASNALFDQSLVYLQRHSKAEKFYDIEVIKLNKIVLPGQTIRVVFKKIIGEHTTFSIDRDLYILETTNTIDSGGIRTSKLKVATIDRFPETESDVLVSQMTQAQVFETHPQLNANAYVISYEKTLDNSSSADFDFWLGSEILNVNQLLFRFRNDPLLSTVKSVAGNTNTSSAGGGGGGTSSSGGGNAVTSGGSLGSHYHSITAPFYVNYTYYTDSSNQYHTHNVGIPNHTHNFSIGSHSHSVTPSISTVYGLYKESSTKTLAEADLIYRVNSSDALGRATDSGDGWYELDITSLVCNGLNYRPLQQTNKITISTATNKTCTINAYLTVRSVIQAIAVY